MMVPSQPEVSSGTSLRARVASAVIRPFTLLLLVAVGCGDDVERPPLTWEGEHLRFGTDADELELCAGTLPYLDGATGHLAEVLHQPHTKVDYYWLPDGVEPYCDDDVLGCTPKEHEVFSTLPVHQHELVHALRWPRVLYLPLEEGLAEAFGDDWEPVFPVSGDIEYLLREYDRGRAVPGNAYPLAGHFVSYLRVEHGVESLLALDRATEHSDSFASLETAFLGAYGVGLEDEMQRYEDTYPRCDQTFYRDLAFDCSRNVVAAPRQPDEEVAVTVSMACDDPAVLGPRFDQRWTTVTLDVQVSGLYHVFAGKADGDFTWPIRLRNCEASCFDVEGAIVYDGPFISGRMCFERGRYLFRFTEDVDFDDFRLKVTMVESSCS